MKLLTRFVALGGLDGLPLFRCQQSIHHHLCGRPRGFSDSPATPTAAADDDKDPSWVLLSTSNCRRRLRHHMVSNGKPMAETTTSTGKPLRVSFNLASPPARSLLYYDNAETTGDHKSSLNAIAAHGDSVLLRMTRRRSSSSTARPYDHFVYRSGDGAASRPPSLTLLPDLKFLRDLEEGLVDPNCRPLLNEDTGILRRRGENGEFVLVWIDVLSHSEHGMANLCVFRSGSSQWEHNLLVPIIHEQGQEVMGSLSTPDMALPVGDRFLCWVGDYNSFILCDMADVSSPKLRRVPLPWLPWDHDYYTNDLPPLTDPHSMGVAGTNAVRFVGVEPRCCCGGFGRCSCPKCRHAFTVTTWTLTLTMDEPVVWVKDTVLDCEELWALPGYEGIPRVYLQSPMVSLDNPDLVWFKVISNDYKEKKEWMIQVDTRRKALLADVVHQCTTSRWRSHSCDFRQAKL